MRTNYVFRKTYNKNEATIMIIMIGNDEIRIFNRAGKKIIENENFKNITPELIAILGAEVEKGLAISEAEGLIKGEKLINRWGLSI